LPRFLLHFPFQVVKLALYLIFCTWLHWIAPSRNLVWFFRAWHGL
jgi:hypothetical protein